MEADKKIINKIIFISCYNVCVVDYFLFDFKTLAIIKRFVVVFVVVVASNNLKSRQN